VLGQVSVDEILNLLVNFESHFFPSYVCALGRPRGVTLISVNANLDLCDKFNQFFPKLTASIHQNYYYPYSFN